MASGAARERDFKTSPCHSPRSAPPALAPNGLRAVLTREATGKATSRATLLKSSRSPRQPSHQRTPLRRERQKFKATDTPITDTLPSALAFSFAHGSPPQRPGLGPLFAGPRVSMTPPAPQPPRKSPPAALVVRFKCLERGWCWPHELKEGRQPRQPRLPTLHLLHRRD